MFAQARSTTLIIPALLLLVLALAGPPVRAQTDDPANGEVDPIKLFERGQDAHAKGDTKLALQLYEAALKLKPEFPEAEFQRAMVLIVTNRPADAVEGFKRVVEARPDWGLAYAKFGLALAAPGTFDKEAEPILRKAFELDEKNVQVIAALALIRQHAGDNQEALKLIRGATDLKEATAETWQRRHYIEVGVGDNGSALISIARAIELQPDDPSLRADRASLLLMKKDEAGAIADLDKARTRLTPQNPSKQLQVIFNVARLYALAGKPEQTLSLIDSLDEKTRTSPGFAELRAEITVEKDSNTPEDRAALEKLLQSDPKNARLLARLGNAYRRVDAQKSQDYYYRALQLDPKNEKYAVGYGAALVQLRQFAQAENILRQVVAANSDNYTAHANLALALFEMKRFADALPEYDWLASAKPELAVTYFFMAIAHDNLGEYEPALDAYQKFLARADAVNNKLEIDKVNLRLPTLREQIRRGEGAKRKNP